MAQLAAVPEAAACLQSFSRIEPWLCRRQLELARIPAPTGLEGPRAEWFLRQMRRLGLTRCGLDGAGNALGWRPGLDPEAPAVLLCAHLDTVFPPGLKIEPRTRRGKLYAPGIADNGAGLAALLALMQVFERHAPRLRRSLLFAANVGEEGEGNLRGIRELLEHGRWRRQIGWTLVVDGAGDSAVTWRALASRRLRLKFSGPGGHSWSNAGRPSAIHGLQRSLGRLLQRAQTHPGKSALNIGLIEGGNSINSIAALAEARLDLRATTRRGMERLEREVRAAMAYGLREENRSRSGKVTAGLELLGERPGGQLSRSAPLWRKLRRVDQFLGIATRPCIASTDANVPLSHGWEALTLGGGGRAGGTHTLQEWFDPTGRELGLKRLLLVLSLAEVAT